MTKVKVPTQTFLNARAEWDLTVRKQLNMLKAWQVVGILSLIIAGGSLLFTFQHISLPKMVPYVVEIKSDGRPEFKGLVQNQKLNITDSVVRHYLIRFITDIRSISIDSVVLKQNLSDAYYISTQECQKKLTDMILSSKPFEKANDGLRCDVKITVFERVAESGSNGATWRCEWNEYYRDKGVLKDKIAMSGTFSYTSALPKSEIEAETNPFGLYFTDFFINEKRI